MLSELELAQVKQVLATMQDQLLDNTLPLPIFADMIEECGLVHEAEWIRRLHIRNYSVGSDNVSRVYYLALVQGEGWYPLRKPAIPDRLGECYTFNTEDRANRAVAITAILNVRMAILAGRSLEDRVIVNYDQQGKERVSLALPKHHVNFDLSADQLTEQLQDHVSTITFN